MTEIIESKQCELTLTLKNELSEIERAAREVHAFLAPAEISENCRSIVDLVCEELLVNVINYAYPVKGKHTIVFKIGLTPQEILIHVEDDGLEFNPLNMPKPDISQPLGERAIGGLGIYLVRGYARRMEYRRENNKNILEVWLGR
jgi:anti-sigma regulatory factor (Ser/Thr protein kinase)